jgi:hypothetical protein
MLEYVIECTDGPVTGNVIKISTQKEKLMLCKLTAYDYSGVNKVSQTRKPPMALVYLPLMKNLLNYGYATTSIDTSASVVVSPTRGPHGFPVVKMADAALQAKSIQLGEVMTLAFWLYHPPSPSSKPFDYLSVKADVGYAPVVLGTIGNSPTSSGNRLVFKYTTENNEKKEEIVHAWPRISEWNFIVMSLNTNTGVFRISSENKIQKTYYGKSNILRELGKASITLALSGNSDGSFSKFTQYV